MTKTGKNILCNTKHMQASTISTGQYLWGTNKEGDQVVGGCVYAGNTSCGEWATQTVGA